MSNKSKRLLMQKAEKAKDETNQSTTLMCLLLKKLVASWLVSARLNKVKNKKLVIDKRYKVAEELHVKSSDESSDEAPIKSNERQLIVSFKRLLMSVC